MPPLTDTRFKDLRKDNSNTNGHHSHICLAEVPLSHIAVIDLYQLYQYPQSKHGLILLEEKKLIEIGHHRK